MSVGGEAAVPPPPRPQVIVQVATRPIRHVRQAAGRYAIYALLRWSFESGFYDIIMIQIIYNRRFDNEEKDNGYC